MVDGIICDANSLTLAVHESALLVSLKPELLVALDQCQLYFCSQEESLVDLRSRAV